MFFAGTRGRVTKLLSPENKEPNCDIEQIIKFKNGLTIIDRYLVSLSNFPVSLAVGAVKSHF